MKKINNSLRQGFAKAAEKVSPIFQCNFSVNTWRFIYISLTLSAIAAAVVVILLFVVPKPDQNSIGNISPTFSPTAASNIIQFGYFHNSGNQIVDSFGTAYRISAVNWNGFETSSNIADGLLYKSYQSIVKDVKKLSFNTIVFPFSNEMLRKTSETKGIEYSFNPDLVGLSPLECLDSIIKYCSNEGLRVVLQRYSSKADNSQYENLWYIPNDNYYTEQQFISDWMMLAMRYKDTAVLGGELWHEPKGSITWGSGNIGTDWNSVVERAGNAILAVNPQWLLFVGGINYGSDLTGVKANPINLKVKNKVVYSVKPLFSNHTSFTKSWNTQYGFIADRQISPLFVDMPCSDNDLVSDLIAYINGGYWSSGPLPTSHHGISYSYCSLSPNLATGGIYNSQWTSINTDELVDIQAAIAPPLLPPYDPSTNPSTSRNNVTSFVVIPSLSPTAMPVLTPVLRGYLHTSGNQIVDSYGKAWRLTGVSWNGFETVNHALQGLNLRNYQSILTQIKQTLGFNVIRIPFSNEMLKSDVKATAIDLTANPKMAFLTPLQCLDLIIEFCGTINLGVILERYSSKADNSQYENLWYIPNDNYYTKQLFISDWVMLANRYKGTIVLGGDLWHEPKGSVTWGSGDIGTDWNSVAERAGNAILAVNPQWLVFVGGINYGSDLTGVKVNPINLKVKNKVVYSVHLHSYDNGDQSWYYDPKFPENLRPMWSFNFGYIASGQIAPVMIAGFGTSLNFALDKVWLPALLRYANGQFNKDGVNDLYPGQTGLSWNFLGLTPTGPYGGILKSDYITPDFTKMGYLYSAIAPSLKIPYVAGANPSQSINNATSVVLMPSNSPSVSPTKPSLRPSFPKSLYPTRPPTFTLTGSPSKSPLFPTNTPTYTYTPTATPTTLNFGYFHTSGNQIVDYMGHPWQLTGVRWFGFDTSTFILQGLWSQNYQTILQKVKSVGFNSVRISYTNQMLRDDSIATGIDYFSNPDLVELSPLKCLDTIIHYCGLINIKVILERHSALADNAGNENIWYIQDDPYYTESQFINDWVMLARRYKNTAVIGADLWNQPKGLASWAMDNIDTDWNSAAERVGNAILAENPDWLIFVEGINFGTDLRRVTAYPIKLNIPNKVVYSVHLFSMDNGNQTWYYDSNYPKNLRPMWNDYFGFIARSQIAPIWIGSFGTSLTNKKDHIWLPTLLTYLNGEYTQDGVNDLPVNHTGMSWTYEALNPYGPPGGIFYANWTTVVPTKVNLLQPHLAPFLLPVEAPPGADPSKSFNDVSAVTPPRTFGYFHTSGNQIVDGLGVPYQITGVNWNGFDTFDYMPQGLDTRNYKSILNQVQLMGFNAVKLTYCNQMLRSDASIVKMNYNENSDMKNLSPLQVMDIIIDYCGVLGLRVILVRYSSLANNYYNENIWYIPDDSYYTEQRVIEDWVMLAARYRGTAVMAVDLWHKPKGTATWGTGNVATDWDLAAQRIGNNILAVNPDLLIVVEGLYWSFSLQGVATNPVVLNIPNKVVYSVHVFGYEKGYPGYTANTVPTNQNSAWYKNFGFVYYDQLAPLLIGEFGTSFEHPSDYIYLPAFMKYMNGEFVTSGVNELVPGHKGISWCYYSLFPVDAAQGILELDGYTTNLYKITSIKTYFASSPALLLPRHIPNTESSSVGGVTSLYPDPTMAPTTMPTFGYLSTSGNQLVDGNGKYWRITGINWNGFEGTENIPQGLWVRTYASILQQMKDLGFNTIRIPFSSNMLRDGSMPNGIDFILNPDLRGLTPLECLDKIIAAAGSIGLRIVLDRHCSQSGLFWQEGLWYIPGDPYYTEQQFISDWVMLARRYKGTAVIGIDLWNEPKLVSTWGAGAATDWNKAAERVGNAVLAVNSDWLIFVEGVGGSTWWGGDLRNAGQFPVQLNHPNKLVYSVHEYCKDVSDQIWFNEPTYPDNLRPHWDIHFGYLFKTNTAPIWVGEFGTAFKYPTSDYAWIDKWIRYINGELTTDGVNELSGTGKLGISWMFSAVNPGGNTGGILLDDWVTVDTHKLSFIQPAMAPLLTVPYVPSVQRRLTLH